MAINSTEHLTTGNKTPKNYFLKKLTTKNMARLTAPLLSLQASKQLGKALIYKTKNNKAFVTKYNIPGGQNPCVPTEAQTNLRTLYGVAIECWKKMTSDEKQAWDAQAITSKLKISGWNYFYKKVIENPAKYLGPAFYGDRYYALFEYGNQSL